MEESGQPRGRCAKASIRGSRQLENYSTKFGDEMMSQSDSHLPVNELRTQRLLLRRWREGDLAPFATMNADPQVMEHFPSLLSKSESDALATRIQTHFDEHGYGLWAVEIPQTTSFAGFIGLSTPRFEAHFTPCTEIGWRLAAPYWGQGYATEGARRVLTYAFDSLRLSEVVSLTASCNLRSIRVMQRIDMRTTPKDDFDHPLVPAAHRLSRHVLYRIRRNEANE